MLNLMNWTFMITNPASGAGPGEGGGGDSCPIIPTNKHCKYMADEALWL